MAKSTDLTVAIRDFCKSMDELGDKCEEAAREIHKGEDPFWEALWKHEKAFCLLFGVAGAVLPVLGLIAWHLSRGGTIF